MSSISNIARVGRHVLQNRAVAAQSSKRGMGAVSGEAQYRNEHPKHSKFIWNISILPTFVMSFWMGTQIYKHGSHLVDRRNNIKPEEWTDEELGIPPDEEDIYPPGYVPLAQRL